MTRPTSMFAAAATALVCASCAPVEPEQRLTTAGLDTERQCFFVREIDGYSDAPDADNSSQRFYVETGPSERWLFETFAPCSELDFAHQIAFDTRASSICTGDLEMLLVPSTIPDRVDRCQVTLLGKALPEQ